MEKIRNLSIRKTIILYMGINLIVCFFLSSYVIRAAEKWQESIWWKYVDEDIYIEAEMEANQGGMTRYRVEVPRIGHYEMTQDDSAISELCDALQTWSMPAITSIGIIITVCLFYRIKIKRPLKELEWASKLIADDTLDFTMEYASWDELGRLCAEFERMRVQLKENNSRMWGMVEEQKALRAAIGHDIRSPLAVLKGYQEMLLEFVPENELDKEKVMEILHSGMRQIGRLHEFADTMLQLSRLEDRQLQYQDLELPALVEEAGKTADMLSMNTGKHCQVRMEVSRRSLVRADAHIIMEVTENLLANALRYAEKEVGVTIAVKENVLAVTVRDDGEGFREEPEKLMKAYYHVNPNDDLSHFGLGLYLCRVYCERHGGRLVLRNQVTGGAEAVAVFQVKE